MNQLSDEKPKSAPEGGSTDPRGRSRSGFMWFAGLALVVLGILFYVLLARLDRVNREVSQLRTQVQESNMKSDVASSKAESALDHASAAAQIAQQAASERDQAEKLKAQAQQQAQQAQQQAQAAQQEVAQAEAKAEEYRKQREAELDRLQQALGQIASTRRTAMGLVMTLGSKSIRFAFDQSTLRTEDKEVLSRIAGILSTLKGYQIYVYGYTDDIGTREYNQKLSERRAQSVYDYLVKSGLDPNIMTTRGFGEADPLVPGDSAKARAINRRVEIGLVDSTIKPITSLNQ
ncbi:MAG: OmpA family protein [Terriglobia bacterium]|jgi:outer membrane protein OmpA-like peptidoglycan-associated protein